MYDIDGDVGMHLIDEVGEMALIHRRGRTETTECAEEEEGTGADVDIFLDSVNETGST